LKGVSSWGNVHEEVKKLHLWKCKTNVAQFEVFEVDQGEFEIMETNSLHMATSTKCLLEVTRQS
jgi:hypothetical protein